uniref:ADP-ribosylation factor-like protein 6-interacting protein 6 n=1 Tax=Myxine glutinosa TaxID=7769 RepID=UPI00358E2EC2
MASPSLNRRSQAELGDSDSDSESERVVGDERRLPGRRLAVRPGPSVASLLGVLVVAFVIWCTYSPVTDEKVPSSDEIPTLRFVFGIGLAAFLSLCAGLSCCTFSWSLAYFDSFEPGMFPPTPLSSVRIRKMTGHSFHMVYTMAILNGLIMTIITFWWIYQ